MNTASRSLRGASLSTPWCGHTFLLFESPSLCFSAMTALALPVVTHRQPHAGVRVPSRAGCALHWVGPLTEYPSPSSLHHWPRMGSASPE